MLFLTFICAAMICTFLLIIARRRLRSSLARRRSTAGTRRYVLYLIYLLVAAGLAALIGPFGNGAGSLAITSIFLFLTFLCIAGAAWPQAQILPCFSYRIRTSIFFIAGSWFLTMALCFAFMTVID